MGKPMKGFPAKFAGNCKNCARRIHPGERIVNSDKGFRHAICPSKRRYVHCAVCGEEEPAGTPFAQLRTPAATGRARYGHPACVAEAESTNWTDYQWRTLAHEAAMSP